MAQPHHTTDYAEFLQKTNQDKLELSHSTISWEVLNTQNLMQAFETMSNHHPPAYVWLDRLIPTAITTSVFGNIVTFTVAVGQFGGARHFWWEFQTFVAVAWLFFLLSFFLAVAAYMAMTFQRDHVLDAFGRGRDGYRKWRDGGMGSKGFVERMSVAFVVKFPVALVLVLLLLLAFLFLSLCISSYALAVGWFAFAITIILMILSIVVWVLQEHA